ncbi:zinc-binding dehydrogenase [Streptomyces sp. NPDC088789]|uniref:zinc-binding dehydrogenase n=1 Tax=Streptomyces sp. NPDC088789 TaxID=3365899 RepID=UPI003804F589
MGVGELGHLTVQMAAAMGAEVTIVSRSIWKHQAARRLGATHVLAADGPGVLGGARDRFDLILNTVSAPLAMDHHLAVFRPGGDVRYRFVIDATTIGK